MRGGDAAEICAQVFMCIVKRIYGLNLDLNAIIQLNRTRRDLPRQVKQLRQIRNICAETSEYAALLNLMRHTPVLMRQKDLRHIQVIA